MCPMCSRYEIDAEWEILAETFGLDMAPPDYTSGEIRPTDQAVVLVSNRAFALKWGLTAPWNGKPLINARSETLEQKQTFRPLLSRRCLVPAKAYFEWRKEGKVRLKNRISLNRNTLMAFAGLYTDDQFTIITCASSPSIAHIHNRMPVILPETSYRVWCDPARPFGEVRRCLKPFSEEGLVVQETPRPTSPQGDLFGSPT